MSVVGILGASGAVGRTVAGMLATDGHRLRLGVHTAPAAVAIGGAVETVRVDATDPAALAHFCAGCHTVVNCAGPSCLLSDSVGGAALAANASYVDPGGDEALRLRLATATGTAIVGAGMSPGLSGLLPRWLARHTKWTATALTAWCGGLERFTPAAAADMVASRSDGYGEPLAAWRNGKVVPRCLTRLIDVSLPPFSGRVIAYPFLTAEMRRLAVGIGLDEARWYNVFAGHQTFAVLSGLHVATAADLAAAGTRLANAAAADLAGGRPYQIMAFELSGSRGCRTLTLRADDGYALTAAVVAEAAAAAIAGVVRPGAHFAADVLDADAVVARVRATGAVIEMTDGPVAATVEEGVL